MVLRHRGGAVYENRRKPGELGPFVEGYRARLLSLGYTPGSVESQLKVLGQVGRWMQTAGLDAAELNEACIEQFLAARGGKGHPRVPGMRSFVALLEYLRDEHVIPTETVPVPTVLEEFVGTYRDWLITERGLAASTVLRFENLARRFLCEHSSGAGEVNVQGLTGADVSGFMLAERARLSLGAVKGRTAVVVEVLAPSGTDPDGTRSGGATDCGLA
jgi:integrase/recombinase XerD